MKNDAIRKTILICQILTISIVAYPQMQKGRGSLGYFGGYTTVTENGVLGIDYRYNLTNLLRISPSVSALVRDSEYKGWLFDINVHYVITCSNFFVYPLVGISYSYWDYYDKEIKKYSAGKSYLGSNVGLGTEIYVVEELIVGLDIKYNKFKKNDQLILALRIAYHFSY